MNTRLRLSRLGKWVGLLMSLLLAALMFAPTFTRQVVFELKMGRDTVGLMLDGPSVVIFDEHSSGGSFFQLPMWLWAAGFSILTLLFWWLDRTPIPTSHCRKCRYDLTGNTSGVCPECGEKT